MTEQLLTIGGSFAVSVMGMLITNAISAGWRTSKITDNLREIVSNHVGGLHQKLDAHFRDDVDGFTAARKETAEVGHALREKITQNEFWNRDNFLQVKHFDEKISHLVARLEHQDRVSDARHEMNLTSVNENRAAHADVVKRLDLIEKNGKH